MQSAPTKNFDHQLAESNWYQHWVDQGYFHSIPDHREPYAVVIPPPNVTGILHMGHCLNNTIQDILVRRARQLNFNACWVPGTDHASIATETKVVQMLREQGIAKSSLSRDEFLQYAWQWKEKYGGIILQQLKKLGCSLDWKRTAFTMDPAYYQSVIDVFVDLHRKGLIYRGKRMINWDPKAKTALSDEEVIFKDTQSKLYFIKYQVEGEAETFVTIATVRPETILGDTAVAVHPDDERFKHIHGKRVIVPLANRSIPVITDEYVSMEFGTGALKVTPAHDMNDNQLGIKHGLEVIDIMNDDGTFSEDAGMFVGEDRFTVRKKIVPLLQEQGHLLRMEDYANQVGYSERSDAVVEPRLSMQWWVKMKPLAEPALKVVEDNEIDFHPAKFKNLYRHWMENIRDWCISRQLWWGHRIPAWYDAEGNVYVAKNENEAWEQYCAAKNLSINHASAGNILKQDEDCLDTWFSSWLWPFETFHGYSQPNNTEVKYYYPTATLVTAPEIIFFWVARMIMAGLEYQKEVPFKDVYFTGIVRDEQGRKMSKSLGNSPDLLALIDKYGADAVRFGIIISSPAGNDLLFDVKEESTLKQGSFFVNKMWNALKLLRMWSDGQNESSSANTSSAWAHQWFAARFAKASAEVHQLLLSFKLSEALKLIYSLIWDDYCSWYLEWIKPPYGESIAAADVAKAQEHFEKVMLLLHPYMPFITEEIYHGVKLRTEGDDLTCKLIDENLLQGNADAATIETGEQLKQLITAVRDQRNKLQLKPKDQVSLFVEGGVKHDALPILARQVNAKVESTTEAIAGASVITVNATKLYLVTTTERNLDAERDTLEKELNYQRGFLQSVEKKLGNERFVQNAKAEVVDMEKKKQSDALARIKAIEEALMLLQ